MHSQVAAQVITLMMFLQYDEEMAAKAKEAADNNEVLRYVGVIDIQSGKCAVSCY